MWHRWPSRWESAGNSAERFYIILSPRLRDDIEGPPNIDKKSLHFLCTCACQDSMMTPCNERFYTGCTKSLVALGVLRFNWYKHVFKNSFIFVFFLTPWVLEQLLCAWVFTCQTSDSIDDTETRYYDENEVTNWEIKRKYAGTNYGTYSGPPMPHESVYPDHNSWGILCVCLRVLLPSGNQPWQQGG